MSPNTKSVSSFAAIVIFVCLFLIIRCYIASHESLWTDELWSLVVSTGHSPYAQSDVVNSLPTDYAEMAKPMPCSYFRKYLTFNQKHNLIENVLRGCSLGEYSPPLYYLILCPWLQTVGISDFNLRLPSIIFSLVSLPFLWSISRILGETKASVISCYFFAFAPMSLFFSTEARLYSLLIFSSSILLWLTLLLSSDKWRPNTVLAILWSCIGGLGLATSSLFFSPIAASSLWLVLKPIKFPFKRIIPMLCGSIAISFVCSARIPHSSAVAQVAIAYYAGSHSFLFSLVNPFTHLLELFGGFGNDCFPVNQLPCIILFVCLLPAVTIIVPLVKSRRLNSVLSAVICVAFFFAGLSELTHIRPDLQLEPLVLLRIILCIVFILILTQIYVTKRFSKSFDNLDPRTLLLYLNILFAISLPEVYDVINKMHLSDNHRYVLVCLPAAFTLFAITMSKLSNLKLFLGMLIITCLWLPMYAIYAHSESRRVEDYRELGRLLARSQDSDALIFSYRFPVNIFGLAHYMPVDKKIIAWSSSGHSDNVAQDLLPLVKNKKGIYLARIGPGCEGRPYPIETWLRTNAQEKKKWNLSNVLDEYCQYFVPKHGEVFQ